MTDLQIIESLCDVIEQQAALVRELVTQLEQFKAVEGAESERAEALRGRYREAIGDTGIP